MAKKKKRNSALDPNGQPYKADSPEFGELLWGLLNDYDRMGNRCTSSVRSIMEMVGKSDDGTVFDTRDGPLGFLDRGGDVLSVAHVDAVGHLTHFAPVIVEGKEPWVFSPWLDDRLGLFVILDVLPMLGLNYDILLCTNEEKGASTGYYFEPPKDKKYRFICEFDRMGEDIVNYQYRQPDLEKALVDAGFPRPARGSYTDIVELEHLGVGAFNVAVGYEFQHTKWCRANLEVLHRQLVRYCRFAEATEGITFPFDRKQGYNHFRTRGTTKSSTTSSGTVAPYQPPSNGASGGPVVVRNQNGSPNAFEFYKDDLVLDADATPWRIQTIGGFDKEARCWKWAVCRTETTGTLHMTTKDEWQLTLMLSIDGTHRLPVRVSEWILKGRQLDWRTLMWRRGHRLLTHSLNGKTFPEKGWTSRGLRLLWQSHGTHYDENVKAARSEYERYFAVTNFEGNAKIVHNSWDYQTQRPMSPLHFNDLVFVDGHGEAVVAALYPLVLSNGKRFLWVDYITPDQLGMSLDLVEESRVSLITPNTSRFGGYRPEDAIRLITVPEKTDGPTDPSTPAVA